MKLSNNILEYQVNALLHFIPSVILVLPKMLEDLPYSYYQALRLITTGYAIYAVWWFEGKKKERTASKTLLIWGLKFQYVLGFVAVMFNPIVPFRISKESWQIFDVVAAFILAVFAVVKVRVEKKEEES